MEQLLKMLQWKRPGGDTATKVFADTYLQPVFGEPDSFGNYIATVSNKDGSHPNLCFTAHYDTVHSEGGFQELTIKDDVVTSDADCLGADCTTGIWLCLEMISSGIPGVYVIHADEESGCKGSSALVRSNPDWFVYLDAVISFDRFGTKSVITHQCGSRTASDAFACSFANAVNMHELLPDSTGVYTDSNEYADVVSECTNISVGYYAQHTKSESQDLNFAMYLRDSLINADWSKLVFERDPKVIELDSYSGMFGSDRIYDYEDSMADQLWAKQDIIDLLTGYPEELAEMFYNNGISADYLAEEAGIDSQGYLSRYIERDERYFG